MKILGYIQLHPRYRMAEKNWQQIGGIVPLKRIINQYRNDVSKKAL
jgi:hypothetical protein